jgi:hypothetical protein
MRQIFATRARSLPLLGKEGFMRTGLLLLLAGCIHTVAMTPDIVQQDGRLVVAGTPEKVFQAVKDALDSENIGVSVAKPESGLIVSKRFVLAAYATGNQYIAVGNQDTVQYDITVKAAGSDVEVVVAPRGFHNDIEVTERDVWQLDGPQGQRSRWQRLFAQIKKML